MTDDPRLTLADVLELVHGLPFGAIEQLAEGPMPAKSHCRVCGVLKPLLRSSPEAAALYGWHDFFEDTPALDRVTKNWKDRPTEEERHLHRRAFGEWKRVAGMLSYARCCTIYLAASLYLEQLRE